MTADPQMGDVTGSANDAHPAAGGTARIGVLVVAYNAASTLKWVLDRLPASFRDRVDHVLVCDDASQDDTYRIGLEYGTGSDLPLTVVSHAENLGYGGNQKWGYRWAIEHDLDIVVLLHGDGQYAPEVIESLVEPLENGTCDAVFGSRMMNRGAALEGGMPPYKYVGNKILSRYENLLAGMRLTEWHSGYRAYRVDALRDIAFESNSDVFDFDTEIILQLHEAGKTIVEVPIPTYYGEEICHVNGLKYAFDVVRDVTRYRLRKLGFGNSESAEIQLESHVRLSPESLYGQLQQWMQQHTDCRVLLIGCGDGQFGELLRDMGCYVVGIDNVKLDLVGARVHEFVEVARDAGVPAEVGDHFDVVVVADALTQYRNPTQLFGELARVLTPGGSCLIGVPNFSHWYPRLRTALGLFGYDRRGILDHRNVRFFTRRSFERLATSQGWRVRRRSVAGLAMAQMDWGGAQLEQMIRPLGALDRVGVRFWPNMFGLQYVYELVRD